MYSKFSSLGQYWGFINEMNSSLSFSASYFIERANRLANDEEASNLEECPAFASAGRRRRKTVVRMLQTAAAYERMAEATRGLPGRPPAKFFED